MSEKLAIHGGTATKTVPFPNWPQYGEKEEKVLMEVLHSGIWWRTPGTKTLEFEEKFAAYHQANYGLACTNGTAALEIVVAALGIGLGDEVIVPDFTFIASAGAVLSVGAMPVLVDVDPGTYCIDPEKVEAAITPRTKAIIAVHIAGHPSDMDRLKEIARIHNLFLIEDSAHAHGSEWKGHKVGAIGTVGTFSFQASKLMTAGEGGMVITNNEDLAVRLRSVHDCGRMPGQWFYSHYIYGSNYRLSEWQGAVLTQQLGRLEAQAAVRTPNAEGIPTQASYPPVRKLDVFQNGEFRKRLAPDHAREAFSFLKSECPVTDDLAENTVWLVHRTLLGSLQDTAEIAAAIRRIQKHADDLL